MNERRLVPLSEVQPRRLCWLWPNRIPLGALSLLEGDPGQSKSLLSYDLAARLTTGRAMPDIEGDMPPVGTVLLQAEDHLATLKANLEASKADTKRILAYDKISFADRPLLLPDDLSLIEAAVAQVSARLVVIDPLTAFLGGQANTDQAIRKALGPLAAFAERAGVAVLLVRHLTKSGGTNPLYRGAGSIAIIAHARSALRVTSDPSSEDPHRHVLVQTKTNLASASSLTYRTVKKDSGIVIEWLGESKYTARDLANTGHADKSALAEAAYVLYSILVDGPVWAREAIKLAARAGITKRTLDRAKLVLGVETKKRGSGPGSRWYWRLPDDEARLRPFKEKSLDDLMAQLLEGEEDDFSLLGTNQDHKEFGPSGNEEDDNDEGQLLF